MAYANHNASAFVTDSSAIRGGHTYPTSIRFVVTNAVGSAELQVFEGTYDARLNNKPFIVFHLTKTNIDAIIAAIQST